MSDSADQEESLIILVAATARMVAQSVLEKGLPPTVEGARVMVEQLRDRSWAQIGLPTVQKMAPELNIDPAPLQSDAEYGDLFVQVLLREISQALDGALRLNQGIRSARPIAEAIARELAAASAADAEGVSTEQLRDWLHKGLARWAWHHQAYDRLRDELSRAQIATDAVSYSQVFERAFLAALPPSQRPGPASVSPAPTVRFRHIGPARRIVSAIPPPEHQTDYALCVDPSAGGLVYVQRNGERQIGPIFRLHPGEGGAQDRWDVDPMGVIDLPDVPRARISCFYDASRRGIACWTYLKHEIFFVAPYGVLFGPDGPVPIAAEDPPPLNNPVGFRAVFVYDRSRDVTVAVTPNALCELSTRGRWAVRLGGKDQPPLPELNGEILGAAYDAVKRRVIIWTRTPREQGPAGRRLAFVSWDGAALRPLPHALLPHASPDYGREQAAAICEHPVRGLIAFLPQDARLYALGPEGFTAHDGPAEPAGARAAHVHPLLAELAELTIEPPQQEEQPPVWFEDTQAAYDLETDRLVLGPGVYVTDRGPYSARKSIHQIVTRHAGQWSYIASEMNPPPDEHRMHSFLGGVLGPLAFDSDHAVRRLDDVEGWVVCGDGVGSRISVTLPGPGETPYAVGEDGAVRRLGPADGRAGRLAWQAVSTPADLPPELASALRASGRAHQRAAAYDLARDRIVIYCASAEGALTAVWEGGSWTAHVADAPHPDMLLHRPRSTIRLVYDASLRQVIRLGASDVSAWTETGWRSLGVDPILRAVHPEHREVIRATEEGRILVLDLEARVVVGFRPAGCAVLGTYEWPASFMVTSRPASDHPGFPFVYVGGCARTRSLRTHSSRDDRENYALDLGPFCGRI